MPSEKIIYIYTASYPYTPINDIFIRDELKIASNIGYKIILVPVRKGSQRDKFPNNIIVDESICGGIKSKIFSVVKTFFSTGELSIWNCVLYDKAFRFKYLKFGIRYIYAANLVYTHLEKYASKSEPAVFYGYWMYYTPIAFAYYKFKHPLSQHRFICRGHGTDVYTTKLGVYVPKRQFMFTHIDSIFTVSKFGCLYLRNKYPEFSFKVQISRLGVVRPIREIKKVPGCLTVVSCASVIKIKRIRLLFDSLNFYVKDTNKEIVWHHFGGGNLLEEIKKYSKSICDNKLKICFHGNVPNKEIVDFYSKNELYAFISVSESEGVPVSMMEAISCGIPIISTDVGGCSEIVTKETGVLIPKDFKQREFNDGLSYLFENYSNLSLSALDFYNHNYDAEKNYSDFYEVITK